MIPIPEGKTIVKIDDKENGFDSAYYIEQLTSDSYHVDEASRIEEFYICGFDIASGESVMTYMGPHVTAISKEEAIEIVQANCEHEWKEIDFKEFVATCSFEIVNGVIKKRNFPVRKCSKCELTEEKQ